MNPVEAMNEAIDNLQLTRKKTMTEQELVKNFRVAKETYEDLTEQVKAAKEKMEALRDELVEELMEKGATATAKYEGIGRVNLLKPILGASSKDPDKLFEYLKQVGREDLIKPYVHHKTLSTFVKELVDEGKDVPEFITYWRTNSVKLTK